MNDWITDEEYTEAYKQAEIIAEKFMADKFSEGEEIWDEIRVNRCKPASWPTSVSSSSNSISLLPSLGSSSR